MKWKLEKAWVGEGWKDLFWIRGGATEISVGVRETFGLLFGIYVVNGESLGKSWGYLW